MSATYSLPPPASSSRLPPLPLSKIPIRAGGAGGTPSGIPISTSRIVSTSPRSPSSLFSSGSPIIGKPSPVLGTTGTGDAKTPSGQANMQTTPILQTGRPSNHDARNQHLSASNIRTVARSVSDRSIDRQSIDSVQLAMKLDRASEDIDDPVSGGTGLSGRFILDELPPFMMRASGPMLEPSHGSVMLGEDVSSLPVRAPDTMDHSQRLDASADSPRRTSDMPISGAGKYSQSSVSTSFETPERLRSNGAVRGQSPLQNSVRPSSSRSDLHTPSRQITPAHNSTSQLPRADPIFPKSTSMTIGSRNKTVGMSSARQRTVSAVKASHTATPRSASAHELGRMGAGKRSPPTGSPSSGARSSGAGLTSSTSSREYYPAEAYMVPRIAEYRPANGDWENMVIPTVAKKLHPDVGLGIYARRDVADGGDEDELVTEWTPDGRPVKVVKVEARSRKVDPALGGLQSMLPDEGEPNGDLLERQRLDTDWNPSRPSQESEQDGAVLADILREHEYQEAEDAQISTRHFDRISREQEQIPHIPSSPSHLHENPNLVSEEIFSNEHDVSLPIFAKTQRTPLGKANENIPGPQDSTPPEIRLSTGTPRTAPLLKDPQPFATEAPTSQQEPIRSELPLPTVPLKSSSSAHPARGQTQVPKETMEMQSMAAHGGAEKSSTASRSRNMQKQEDHGGGCRCVVM